MTNPAQDNFTANTAGMNREEEPRNWAALREERGLTLADAYAQTRISIRNLTALEQGDFAALPPAVYTRAFIREYATLIGVNPGPLLGQYETYLKTSLHPSPIATNNPSAKRRRRIRPAWVWGVLAFLIIAVLLLSFLLKNPGGLALISASPDHGQAHLPSAAPPADSHDPGLLSPQTPASETDAPLSENVTANSSPTSVPGQVAPPILQTAAVTTDETATQQLTITAREITWIGIRIDQEEGRQALLQPGETVTYAGNVFRLHVGNAGGIDLTLQGNPLASLGKRGQVVRVTLP